MLAIGKMNPDSMNVGRNAIEHRRLKRDLLRVGDRRHEQPGAERADQEQRHDHGERQPVAAHRQVEQDAIAATMTSMRRRLREHEVRQRLADDERRASEIGAIRICSIVPRSFSRTIDSAVETTAVIIAM